ncbi:hypothetical protein [Tsukamurella sp. NPDC003166]|uniref:Eco57I restriction-modification methylase domain-containing protein n=1 Tax=Tsukamurella sp. NPDC003166 TaxID=3154444 RepID=UPI0033AF730A
MTTSTTNVLNSDQRRFLDGQTQRARAAAQRAAEDALRALAVGEPSRPAYLSDEQNTLRLALRDKARQLGDDTSRTGEALTNLVHDVAYEQWHRLLFARFLEVNGLLRHPEYRDISLSLEDCGDLASDLSEPDGWAVAARFASEILPGVFRLTDPAVQVRVAAEHRTVLERLLLEIPGETFKTEDALGWVYQFWQTAEKKRVKESGAKIGGADLPPVTQLFTENYMVRFLLENSLGAWWAARHPASPLVGTWEYLRRDEAGTPAAGAFDGWPERAADVTVIDPCCGSGHFLVAMFGMLWRMRAEEEDLTPADAQDAVLRNNLHGLELDPRCTQIATFNVALEAWKQGGFRDLPAPQVACSGIPVRSARRDWERFAGDDIRLRDAMARLHSRFRDADTLGSLIDPRSIGGELLVDPSDRILDDLLAEALRREHQEDTVLGHAVLDSMRAFSLLGRTYTLVATNPPFLKRGAMGSLLREYADTHHMVARGDLATMMLDRCLSLIELNGTIAAVSPQNWLFLKTYSDFRGKLRERSLPQLIAVLGEGAFWSAAAAGAYVTATVLCRVPGSSPRYVDAAEGSVSRKENALREMPVLARLSEGTDETGVLLPPKDDGPRAGLQLARIADVVSGIQTGDVERFVRRFWEIPEISGDWSHYQTSPTSQGGGGLDSVVYWADGSALTKDVGAVIRGARAWGKRGIAVKLYRSLEAAPYLGSFFDQSVAVLIPRKDDAYGELLRFATSPDFAISVRSVDRKVNVTPAALGRATIDIEGVKAAELSLTTRGEQDVTQWVFSGSPKETRSSLQVAVARILGYRWPDGDVDNFDDFVDSDGIAALCPLPGEPDLATRLREVLAVVYGGEWSSSLERSLVVEAGGKNGRLEDWLRNTCFGEHVRIFGNRPFFWHIWDGRKDGFSAIVNYHKLDRRTLEKLTFTSLGAWVERQRHEARAERAGADARLAAAEDLQRRLKLILDGEPPYDVYVRWKSLAEQPIGWDPDLDDGIRLNIRPFVTAGVLRAKVNVHWKKDRGKNPDGSERRNDLHPSLEERRAARREAETVE